MELFNKLKKLDKRTLLDSSEKYENAYYQFLRMVFDRLISGFFIFKTRKGELLAGATTFFTLLTISPLLLLIISLYGRFVGDVNLAYEHVMTGIKEGMPQLAPWIYKSIQTIIKTQLSKDTLNWVNITLLIYTGAGLSGTLVFGMNNIAGVQQKGGWLTETFKSLISAIFITSFITMALALTFQGELIASLFKNIPLISIMLEYAGKSGVQIFMFTVLFTFYFKFITEKNIRWSDGVMGAITTIVCFTVAKSFYWIYVHYMKAELQQSFGNFYTMIVAVLYIYFMISSFFYGASVAFAPSYQRKLVKEFDSNSDEPPAIPPSNVA